MTRIFLSPPHTTAADRQALLDAFDSNWLAPIGPALNGFEDDFVALTGAEAAVGLSSGTAGLHLALLVLGVQRGDKVAVSTFTFAATLNAIMYVGAEPILIDSEPSTWNMCPDLLDAACTEATGDGKPIKAVIPVDLYGQCCDYTRLSPIFRKHDLLVVEDAAEALGAHHQATQAGRFGHLGVFSFNGNKIITTSGGGMVVGDSDLVEKIRYLSTQARQPVPHYEHIDVGYNYRLSNLLAALGRTQLATLEDRIRRRTEIYNQYKSELGDIPGVSFQPIPASGRSNYWLTCMRLDPTLVTTSPESIRLALEALDIESRPLWKPMHEQPIAKGATSHLNGLASQLFRQGLCLPSGSDLTDGEQDHVVHTIHSVFTNA
jgi:dTDP-4-amino-4,6-dideoxygalactose transaminase